VIVYFYYYLDHCSNICIPDLFFHEIPFVIVYFRLLSTNNLRGEIPTHLGSLTNLYSLYDIMLFHQFTLGDSLFILGICLQTV